MNDDKDLYLVLGVPSTATQEEIVCAYRGILRRTHPDTRSAAASEESDELLRQALAAYAVLRDPQRRARYDRLRTPSTAPPPTPVRVPRRPPIPHAGVPLRAGPVIRETTRAYRTVTE